MENYVITIARMFGSGGRTIGKMLALDLGIPYYDKELLRLASEDSGINEGLFGLADEKTKKSVFKRNTVYTGDILSPDSKKFTSEENLFSFQAKAIEKLAEKCSPCIIIGRCADFILADRENTLNIFIWADKETCIGNTMEVLGYDEKKAAAEVDRINNERNIYYKSHTGNEWTDVRNYDLCLDTKKFTFSECVEIIRKFIEIKK